MQPEEKKEPELTLDINEIIELEKKAKAFNWSPQFLETERQKALEKKKLYQKTLNELEARAKELGFKNYDEQKKQQFIKNFTNPPETYSTEKIVVAPPIRKRIEALEFVNPSIPGRLRSISPEDFSRDFSNMKERSVL